MDFGGIIIPMEHVIYETEKSFAFVNIRPFLSHHILVSSIRREERLSNLRIEEYLDLMKLIRILTKTLSSLGTSWSVIIQDGEEAGQTVKHVHFHLIPRNKGDLVRNNDIYNKINVDIERPNRDFEEMKREAAFLREMIEKGLKEPSYLE